MNLVIGMVLGTVFMGLYIKRWRPMHWALLLGWICLMVAYYYAKNR